VMAAPVAQAATSTAAMSAVVPGAFDNWRTIRIAYFKNDRTALLLGPVREAVKAARRQFGPITMMLQTQWKFGPHLELSFDGGGRADEVFRLVSAIVEPWLASNPSREALDPDAYLALSAKLGMSELEPGPYAPLLDDNSLSLVRYQPARALSITELVESKHLFLSEALELTLDLLALKQEDSEAFSLTLIAMMAISGGTYARDGLSRGFMSFRSHAEYFFAAYDVQGKLRSQFDALDEANAAQVDLILQTLDDSENARFPLPEAHVKLLETWEAVVRRTAERNTRIVGENHELLLADGTFDTLIQDLTASAPNDFQDRARAKPTSELGNAFDEEAGQRIQSSPEFMAYRTTVNFFYLLLPTLSVSPLQKFCFCHLLANAAERHFKVNWRDIVGLAMATAD
jgi:Lantibiotic biosynthesis dehydratase C-term